MNYFNLLVIFYKSIYQYMFIDTLNQQTHVVYSFIQTLSSICMSQSTIDMFNLMSSAVSMGFENITVLL